MPSKKISMMKKGQLRYIACIQRGHSCCRWCKENGERVETYPEQRAVVAGVCLDDGRLLASGNVVDPAVEISSQCHMRVM